MHIYGMHRRLRIPRLGAALAASVLLAAPLLAATATQAATASSSGNNLWSNGSLESGSGTAATGWVYGGSDPSMAQRTAQTRHTGTHALCINDTRTDASATATAQQSIARAGQSYQVSWSQSYTSSRPMSYQVAFLDSAGTVIGTPDIYTVNGASDSWLQAVHEYTAPPGTAALQLQLASGDAAATGSICVDDISVRLIPAAAPADAANLWPNGNLKTSLASSHAPDGWNRGGTDTSLDTWTTDSGPDRSRSVCVADASARASGSWSSSAVSAVQPGLTYELRWQQKYTVTAGSTLSYQAAFSDDLGNPVGSPVSYPLTGTSSGWTAALHLLSVPAGATQLALSITSGAADQGSACLAAISLGQAPQQAPDAGANLMPNPLLTDTNNDGVPDSWTRGGATQDQSQDVYSTTNFKTPPASVCIDRTNPTSGAGGFWVSSMIPVSADKTYLLSYQEYYANIAEPPPPSPNDFDLWVGAEFFDSAGNLIEDGSAGTAVSYINVSGSSNGWQKTQRYLVAPPAAVSMWLVIGSDPTATGLLCTDDFFLGGPVAGTQPYATQFQGTPANLNSPNWASLASNYASLAVSGKNVGTYNGTTYGPILRTYTAGPGTTPASCAPSGTANDPYTGPAFSVEGYIGETTDRCDSASDFGTILGATLSGLNMSRYNYQGKTTDFVSQLANYYSEVPTPSGTQGLISNYVSTDGSCIDGFDGPYTAILLAQILDYYPETKYDALRTDFLNNADTWAQDEPAMRAANWNFFCWDFHTDQPESYAQAGGGASAPVINQPEIAIGVAWIEYQAWLMTGQRSYLTDAEQAMTDMAARPAAVSANFDILGWLAPELAEQINIADPTMHLPIDTFMNWVFSNGVFSAAGIGLLAGNWGGHDATGLVGSPFGFGGDAFVLESNTAISDVAPTVRYAPQEATDVGAWLLRVAINEYQFYPGGLPKKDQSEPGFAQSTGISSIPHEEVRHYYAGQAPYSASDAPYDADAANPLPGSSGWLDYSPYSGWSE